MRNGLCDHESCRARLRRGRGVARRGRGGDRQSQPFEHQRVDRHDQSGSRHRKGGNLGTQDQTNRGLEDAGSNRSTRPPTDSRVCSSTMDTILIGRPSVVASSWKSTVHTLFGASAVGIPGAVRSITADVLIDELDRLATSRGYPTVLRCDKGPELACDAMAAWAGERVGLSFIPPMKRHSFRQSE